MRIIAGTARNLELAAPPGFGVRPTLARSRKALFDSLGPFAGRRVLDLFAGSGALGLEAASRGAEQVVLVERDPVHFRVLADNVARIRKTGVESRIMTFNADALDPCRYASAGSADLIFADPPYAGSTEAFRMLLCNAKFRSAFAGALLVWEVPDTPGAAGTLLETAASTEWNIRKFGSIIFLLGRISA